MPEEKVSVGRGNEIEPTPTARNAVLLASVLGQPQPAIAYMLGMSKPSLTKHFRKEIDLGAELDASWLLSAHRVSALKGIADHRHSGQLTMLMSNKTDMQPKGSIDHTSSDGSMANIVYLEGNGRDQHLDKATIVKELQRQMAEDPTIVEGEVIKDNNKPKKPKPNDEQNSDENSGENS